MKVMLAADVAPRSRILRLSCLEMYLMNSLKPVERREMRWPERPWLEGPEPDCDPKILPKMPEATFLHCKAEKAERPKRIIGPRHDRGTSFQRGEKLSEKTGFSHGRSNPAMAKASIEEKSFHHAEARCFRRNRLVTVAAA